MMYYYIGRDGHSALRNAKYGSIGDYCVVDYPRIPFESEYHRELYGKLAVEALSKVYLFQQYNIQYKEAAII